MDPRDEDTVDFDPIAALRAQVGAQLVEDHEIKIAAATHPGRIRRNNEDQYAVVKRSRKGEVVASSLDDNALNAGKEQSSWLLVVADGVGGSVSGEIASATAIQSILDLGPQLSSWVMQPSVTAEDDYADRVELYAKAIQQALQKQAESNPKLSGMATTITAVYIFGSDAMVVSAGDSRSYLIRDKSIEQITQDHTMGRELEEAGAPGATIQRYQHVLTRCFNTLPESVTFDLFRLTLKPGDRILLCSDGLSDMISDQEILRIADHGSELKETCEQLVTQALIEGGRDNVTVVLASLE